MDDEEYAIVSKKEFLALKKEIDRLKRNPLEGAECGDTLQASIDNLNKSLNIMLEVFKQASDDLKLEEHDSSVVSKQMGPMAEKMDTLIDQNQKIAKGIVAIADMVKEKLDEIEKKSLERPKLPPLSVPKPADAPRPPQSFGPPQNSFSPSGTPPGDPSRNQFFGQDNVSSDLPDMPPLGSDAGMPPLTPPGVQNSRPGAPSALPKPPGKDVMGGLMK